MTDAKASKHEEIPVENIKLFKGKKYFSSKSEKVDELAESIKTNGILEPLIVRLDNETDGSYELIAGETRLRAAAKLNLETVPCEVIDVDDEAAQRIYGESNRYREDISIMQKAFMKKYSKNLQFCPEVKSESFYKVFCEFEDDDKRQEQRYLLLTELTPRMQELVDKKIININAGAAAACLPDKVQDMIVVNLSGTKKVLTEEMVEKIKDSYEKDYLPFGRNISQTKVDEIITGHQAEKVKKVSVKISRQLVRKLPEEVRNKKELSEFVEKLIKEYIANC